MGWGWYFGMSLWALFTSVGGWLTGSAISRIRNTVDDIHDMVTDIEMKTNANKTQDSEKIL
jgi:hypothetical protein